MAAFRDPVALASKGRREAGALHVARDERVADDVNRANAIFVARVNAAVNALRNGQGTQRNDFSFSCGGRRG